MSYSWRDFFFKTQLIAYYQYQRDSWHEVSNFVQRRNITKIHGWLPREGNRPTGLSVGNGILRFAFRSLLSDGGVKTSRRTRWTRRQRLVRAEQTPRKKEKVRKKCRKLARFVGQPVEITQFLPLSVSDSHHRLRVAAGARLATPWLFEPAKRPDDTADYCLGYSYSIQVFELKLLIFRVSSIISQFFRKIFKW